jgi:hypothetical protein
MSSVGSTPIHSRQKEVISKYKMNANRIVKINYIPIVATLLFISLSCQSVPSRPDDIKLYNFDQGNGRLGQNNTQPEQNYSGTQVFVRNQIVTEENSIFPIGIPEKYVEKTEVSAQRPVNFWFEFVPDNMELKVNNQAVQRDFTKWETKVGYTEQVTKFSYEATNRSAGMMSYYLHIVPSTGGDSVPVNITQKYQPIN